MPRIKRTIIDPHGGEGKSEIFTVPLSSRTIGAGVNNKTIYDLKKRGRATYEFPDGSSYLFENLDFGVEMKPANENP